MQKNTVLYRQQQVQYDLNNRAMKRKNAARQAFKKLEILKLRDRPNGGTKWDRLI